MTTGSFIQRVETLFLAVADLDAPSAEVLLAEAAARDPEAVAEVRAMLEPTEGQLDAGVPKVCIDDCSVEAEEPGERIDRYLLRERIGEGGFGTVWRAEQQEPVQREVALKVIKRGMDTRQVIARFAAERQTLARMDHPGIAKVFDGGATTAGLPYFVMELVRGDPLLAACERLHLDLPARLSLFLRVCDAVDHAHQKGVIHRDLKPSNVLVEMRDGRPVPKVIDFGIAKALDDPSAGATALTQMPQMVGTPAYMAPEQAEPEGQDVDTRTDVYALGVLLYELLTGVNPFAGIEQQGALGMLHAILERDPPKPSTYASELRGELDWIVTKAIEKDRARRYGSVREFAADLERHLRLEPVLAGPPSAAYRLRKYVRRHRLQVSAAAGVLVSLIAGMVVSISFALDAKQQAIEARRQEDAAKESAERATLAERAAQDLARREADLRAAAERAGEKAAATTTFLLDTIGLADPDVTQLPDMRMRDALDVAAKTIRTSFAAYPDSEAALRLVIGRAYVALGMPVQARPQLDRALALQLHSLKRDPRALFRITRLLARAQYLTGDPTWAIDGRKARTLGIEIVAARLPEVARALSELATETTRALFRLEDVVHCFDRTVALAQERLADDDELWFELSWVLWACCYELSWRSDELVIADLMDRTAELHRPITHGRITPILRQMLRTALEHRLRAGDSAGAESIVRTTLEQMTPRLGEGHPYLTYYASILGDCLTRRGELAAAEPLLCRAIATIQVLPGTAPFDAVFAMDRLATLLDVAGRPAEAAAERQRIAAMLVELDATSNWRGVAAAFPPGKGSVREAGDRVDRAISEAASGNFRQLVRAVPELIARGRKQLSPGSALRTLHSVHLSAIAGLLAGAQVWPLAERIAREAFEITRSDPYDRPHLERTAAQTLGLALTLQGRPAEAEEPLREALLRVTRLPVADRARAQASCRMNLGVCLMKLDRLAEAEALLEAAYFDWIALDDVGPSEMARARTNWLRLLQQLGRAHYAERLLRERLEAARREAGGESLASLILLHELAAVLGAEQMVDAAELVAPALRDALAKPELATGACNDLAWFVVRVPDRAPAEYGAALELVDRALARDPGNPAFLNTRGVALHRAGRPAEAIDVLLESDRANRATAGHRPTNVVFLVLAYESLGRVEEAAAARAELEELMRKDAFAEDPESRAFHAQVMGR